VTDRTRAVLEHGQVPHLIPGLCQAMVALRNVAWWSMATARRPAADSPAVAVPPAGERAGRGSGYTARGLLPDAGIPRVPARLVSSADDAVEAAAGIAGKVSVKIVSPEITHKTEIGGVRLNVPPDEAAVRDAYRAVTAAAAGAAVEGVLISPMRSGGTELLVG